MVGNGIKLIECPRDAMQGWKQFIPTAKKVEYINSLLDVGFDTIDFGSFVSSKAIPQMSDTSEVIKNLKDVRNLTGRFTKLLAIIANARGAQDACQYEQISYLGFPFSVSETFQLRNTNSTISESVEKVGEFQDICKQAGKELVIYLSMGFGNPYNDPFSEQIVYSWAQKIAYLGVKTISLADTIGLAEPEQVHTMTKHLIDLLPNVEIGVHLHSRPDNWKEKFSAAVAAGCKRFDGALKGIGGCPMAGDELVGNMNSELMIEYLSKEDQLPVINQKALMTSLGIAAEIFR